MTDKHKQAGEPQPGIIREGGYQPTSDPGPVPTSLVRPAQKPVPPALAPSQDKKG